MKVFGIGLSRTGTTSMAIAMMELGFKTGHVCLDDAMYDYGEAFFDTPVWADYAVLDRRYPGSKHILTWRDPAKWAASFSKNLGSYLGMLRAGNDTSLSDMDRRAYIQVFGTENNSTEAFLSSRYHRHRQQAEAFFQDRPEDLLILDLDATPDPWDILCPFLNRPQPATPFPRVNPNGMVHAWKSLRHVNKMDDWLDARWVKWVADNMKNGANPNEILGILLKNQFFLTSIRRAMGDKFPEYSPLLQAIPPRF